MHRTPVGTRSKKEIETLDIQTSSKSVSSEIQASAKVDTIEEQSSAKKSKRKDKSNSEMSSDKNSEQQISAEKTLFNKLKLLTAKLYRLSSWLKNEDEEKTIEKIQLRLQCIEKIKESHDLVIDELLNKNSDFDNVNSLVEEFDDKIFNITVEYKNKLSEFEINERKVIKSEFEHVDTIKLREIKVPEFGGNYQEWQTYKDTFIAIVHNKTNIPNIIKFTYLLDSLKGDARAALGQTTLSDVGYERAWADLLKRYDNKRIIIETHLKGLLRLSVCKPNSTSIRKLINDVIAHTSALSALKYDIDKLAELTIVYIILEKLESTIKQEWEKIQACDELPSFTSLMNFLERQCRILESPSDKTMGHSTKQKQSFLVATSNAMECGICQKQGHYTNKCEQFLKLDSIKRYELVKQRKLCINCLRSNHSVKDCKSTNCKRCNSRHHTLLHHEQKMTADIEHGCEEPSTKNYCMQTRGYKEVLLSTARVLLKAANGRFVECRLLLDSGSQSNFITERFARVLKLNSKGTNINISGINASESSVQSVIKTELRSRTSSFKTLVEFLVIKTITSSLPTNTINISEWNIPTSHSLADPYFNISSEIDALLGAELFYHILQHQSFPLSNSSVALRQTQIGWIITGSIQDHQINSHNFLNRNDHTNELSKQLELFWIQESTNDRNCMSNDEQRCEEHFASTHKRDKFGRYEVRLPLKPNSCDIGESRSAALKRYLLLEKRFKQSPTFHTQYKAFINEYLNLNHMKQINESNDKKDQLIYYLPHHAIIKENSSTTKLRVVFDASAKSSSGLSLNDVLYIGPTIQENLFNILLRFRKFKYAITADIMKMYRQINVNNSDTSLQRILWRNNIDEPIQTFELTTVTYGTASAPYLATKVLQQLAVENEKTYPTISKIIASDFYVDDILTGADNIDEAILIQQEIIKVLQTAGLTLHKWCSNNPKLLDNIPSELRERVKVHENSQIESIKTLGLLWQPSHDHFLFAINTLKNYTNFTRRSVLSDIASIFDPLGFLAPIIINAKIFMQQLWLKTVDWDSTLDEDLSNKWKHFRISLNHINDIVLNRKIVADDAIRYEIHGFSDASQLAFGACVYMRSINSSGHATIRLLTSKSKVAPIQTISIPRLELCAALLLSKLTKQTITALNMEISNITLWTDSTIVLAWIKIPPHKLKTFVANRVAKVSYHDHWKHIRSEQNPADILSRGMEASELVNSTLWWQGPQFLHRNIEVDVEDYLEGEPLEVPELKAEKSTSMLVTKSNSTFDLIEQKSSFQNLLNITAICWRFGKNCRKKIRSTNNFDLDNCIQLDDLNMAKSILVRNVQQHSFEKTYHALIRNRELSSSDQLSKLKPFIDQFGVMRVGGRLENSSLSFNNKHPMIIPAKHHLTDIIFRHYHTKHLHAAPMLLLSIVRQTFWAISGKTVAKNAVHKCLKCYRHKPTIHNQLMGHLPAMRVTPSRAFSSVGIDLCGPFNTKNKFHRKSPIFKTYVVIYICLITKAIHLDLVLDLTTEAFIASLRRFTSRRGKPTIIWSDNATNFVGAHNLMKEISMAQHISKADNINWSFIPPRSPSVGGIWESAVKSFKRIFKKITADSILTYEEMNSLIIEIEGILNSRPLTPISDDVGDLQPLTPAHYLIGTTVTAIPEQNHADTFTNRLSLWNSIVKMRQAFWKRFQCEYLSSLQPITKWNKSRPNLKVGDLVLLKDENQPSYRWAMGRIIATSVGIDGKVRIVQLKTMSGQTTRAVSKLCLLPGQVIETK